MGCYNNNRLKYLPNLDYAQLRILQDCRGLASSAAVFRQGPLERKLTCTPEPCKLGVRLKNGATAKSALVHAGAVRCWAVVALGNFCPKRKSAWLAR